MDRSFPSLCTTGEATHNSSHGPKARRSTWSAKSPCSDVCDDAFFLLCRLLLTCISPHCCPTGSGRKQQCCSGNDLVNDPKTERNFRVIYHKGSKNRKKARKTFAKGYLKVHRQREDFARKTANALVTSHDLIAYEHLQIRNMVKNHKLAKSIRDAAWGHFLGWMKSYAVMHGIEVVAVPPEYTSQDCSGCGKRVQKTLSTRTHVCPQCGLILDRDENAAVNILAKALACTLGHRETSGSPENASGQPASTQRPKRALSKRAG
jgi:IS605 OrfB family transposase